MKIFALGSPEFVNALALGGMEGRSCGDGEELRRWLGEHPRRGEVGILVIEERLADRAREIVDAAKLDPAGPLVVEAPGPGGPTGKRTTPLEMVRMALGISL